MLTQAFVRGVRVEIMRQVVGPLKGEIVFVHGGHQGSWMFDKMQPYFAETGWAGYALNWFGANGSSVLDLPIAIRRGLADISVEIENTVSLLDSQPILIAHSMGGLAAMKYAEQHAVKAMVLLAPVFPARVQAQPIVLPVEIDETKLFPPLPFPMARQLFLGEMSELEALHYYAKFSPISPRCVLDGTRFDVEVDIGRITCPVLVVSAENDPLCPAEQETLAKLLKADYFVQPGRSHNLTLEPRWQETASLVATWLDARLRGA